MVSDVVSFLLIIPLQGFPSLEPCPSTCAVLVFFALLCFALILVFVFFSHSPEAMNFQIHVFTYEFISKLTILQNKYRTRLGKHKYEMSNDVNYVHTNSQSCPNTSMAMLQLRGITIMVRYLLNIRHSAVSCLMNRYQNGQLPKTCMP